MLARTAATHASSEFFADKPADNSPFGSRPNKPSPLKAPDQDKGYFDMIMREGLCRKFRSDQHFVGNGFGYKADGE